MKILTLKGNDIVLTQEFDDSDGRFIFIFCKNGTYYLDTTIGEMWKAPVETLCPEHRAIVEANK